MKPVVFFKCPICGRIFQPSKEETLAMEVTCAGCLQLLTSNPYSTIRKKIPEGSEVVTLNAIGRIHFQFSPIEETPSPPKKTFLATMWGILIGKGDTK